MKKTIITEGKAVELDVAYIAELYTDEKDIEGKAVNGITEVEARVKGDGVDITRRYLVTGQYRPSSSAHRLTAEENAAVLEGVNALFTEYGSTDKA